MFDGEVYTPKKARLFGSIILCPKGDLALVERKEKVRRRVETVSMSKMREKVQVEDDAAYEF